MNGHVYVSQWPNPDIVVLENTAYKVLVRSNSFVGLYHRENTESKKHGGFRSSFSQQNAQTIDILETI